MRTIHFDVTRLFVRGSRFSPTGIDRVVLAYAAWLLNRSDVRLEPVLTMGGRLWSLRPRVLAELVGGAQLFASQAQVQEDPAFDRLLVALGAPPDVDPPVRARPVTYQIPARARWYADVARRSLLHLRPAAPERDSLYLNVSHTGLGDPHVLSRIRAAGAEPIVMVHDLIPIHHPEYCSPQAETRHLRRMRQIVDHAAHVISNSATTGQEFEAYARACGDRVPPVTVIPLGLQPEFLSRPSPVHVERPYFVCVGTIEARKNLAFLLALWRRLEEHLHERTPRLVLVGRRGWENEAVIDHLERSKTVLRLVLEVCDLRDRDLARLVAGAAALLSPTFAEGFDLPVLEALALRTPVIASRIPVHGELAASATLVDPVDGPAWLRAIEHAALCCGRGPATNSPTWPAHFKALEDVLSLATAAWPIPSTTLLPAESQHT
ncbi:MAG TPA: glycosyltransferase family 1 protein [Caulobacteraceae bacterium]|jgi:glycosyltransferase involved in cell wall biosynthesis